MTRWTLLHPRDAAQLLALAVAAIDDRDAQLVLKDALLEREWSALVVYSEAARATSSLVDYDLWQALKWGLAMPDRAWARATAAVLMFVPTVAP